MSIETRRVQFELDSVRSAKLVDTHAHIHFSNFAGKVDEVIHKAAEAGVDKIITVGVNSADSRAAVEMASRRENVWASVGIHPHDAGEAEQARGYISDLAGERKVVAIGECGLDYFKSQTSREDQELALRWQIELALERRLPLIFHVRDALDDFFRITGDYDGIRGVIHSFTGTRSQMEMVVERDLDVALNGIVTFTKDQQQIEAAKHLPLENMLLETDCPFLAPTPNRGKLNTPAAVKDIAEFLAELRGEDVARLAAATTANAEGLFGI
ncbi:MAG TPA: TatD family hydrolase [Candidatus Saccharimonadales bacterium]|nr:TatD family hydrolase [Candidatus Saccharimonadales bacterium]